MGFMWLKMKAASTMSEAILTSGTVYFFFERSSKPANSIKFLRNVHPLKRTVRTNHQESIKPPKMDSKRRESPQNSHAEMHCLIPKTGDFRTFGGHLSFFEELFAVFHGNQKGAPTIWPARQLREGSAWPFGRV